MKNERKLSLHIFLYFVNTKSSQKKTRIWHLIIYLNTYYYESNMFETAKANIKFEGSLWQTEKMTWL